MDRQVQRVQAEPWGVALVAALASAEEPSEAVSAVALAVAWGKVWVEL